MSFSIPISSRSPVTARLVCCFSTKQQRRQWRQSLLPSPQRSHPSSSSIPRKLSLSLSSSPFFLFFCVLKAHFLLQKPLTIRCSAQPRDGEKAPPLLQLVVGGVTELLKLLSPRIQRSTAAIALSSPSVASIANDRCVIAEMTIEMQEMRLLWLIAWMIWFGFFERTTIVLISSQVAALVNPICST